MYNTNEWNLYYIYIFIYIFAYTNESHAVLSFKITIDLVNSFELNYEFQNTSLHKIIL